MLLIRNTTKWFSGFGFIWVNAYPLSALQHGMLTAYLSRFCRSHVPTVAIIDRSLGRMAHMFNFRRKYTVHVCKNANLCCFGEEQCLSEGKNAPHFGAICLAQSDLVFKWFIPSHHNIRMNNLLLLLGVSRHVRHLYQASCIASAPTSPSSILLLRGIHKCRHRRDRKRENTPCWCANSR